MTNTVKIGKPKGSAKTGGRRKGTPNKVNAELKEMIAGALNDVGGQKYLAEQAAENPSAFLTLLAKILPKDITLGGDLNNPLQITHALNTRAIQAIDALIGAVVGIRADRSDAEADTK